jgi:hypothetical protein
MPLFPLSSAVLGGVAGAEERIQKQGKNTVASLALFVFSSAPAAALKFAIMHKPVPFNTCIKRQKRKEYRPVANHLMLKKLISL